MKEGVIIIIMEGQDTLETTLDDIEYKLQKHYEAISEVVTNLELSFDKRMEFLEGHGPSRIILRNGELNTIKKEGKEYEEKLKSFFKLIANSRKLTHVELQGITINSRFLKDLMQAISELGKIKKIKLSFGI